MPRKKRRVTYLVSGDPTIQPSHEVLARTGRDVRYDVQVDDSARRELKGGRSFVVVAHGNMNGTVSWFNSTRGSAAPWLWVGMPKQPRGTFLYLYACKAGRLLIPFLTRCDAFGHVDSVPMPLEAAKGAVLAFLNRVDELIADPRFTPDDWAKELARYIDNAFIAETERPAARWERVAVMLMLQRSMKYDDA